MTIFIYARVSSADQNTDIQKTDLLKRYPGAILREETASATTRNRPVLELILQMIGEGDKLVVWKLDRLARNMKDLLSIVEDLEFKGATLEILDQSIDTGTASGKAFLQMLGVFAEFETNLRKERQMAGIASAKTKGVRFGRKPTLTDEQKIQLRKDASCGHPGIPLTITELSIRYGVSRGTVYNTLNRA